MMGAGVVGLALTPSYAAVGVAAPLLVLAFRLLQGFALGGDVGAATAYMVECAPPGRRGMYVSLQYSTQGIAVLGAGLVGSALAAALTPAQLDAWGWRVAFLIGASVVPLGLALRSGLAETLPEAAPEAAPLRIGAYRRVALLGLLLLAFGTIGNYTIDYMATYAQVTLKMSSAAAFGATTVIGLVSIAMCPIAGRLSDQFGRKPIILIGALMLMLLTVPAYMLIGRFPLAAPLFAVTALLSVGQAFGASPALAAVTESLPPRIRASGVALLYALAITMFGGTTQFVIAWLTKISGSPLAPAWYLAGAGAVGLIAVLLLPETATECHDAGR
jgi:MFS family permease